MAIVQQLDGTRTRVTSGTEPWKCRNSHASLTARGHRHTELGRDTAEPAGRVDRMEDPKETLIRYLQSARDAIVWKVEGLSEYDARRPLTPTGTNLLGLVKHLASVELGYFGDTFGRPSGIELPWHADD